MKPRAQEIEQWTQRRGRASARTTLGSKAVTMFAAAAAFAGAFLLAPEVHAAGAQVLGEGGLLSTLLDHLLGFDGAAIDGPRCAGLRACDLTFLAIIGVVIVAALKFRNTVQRRRLDLARRMVEQGMEPPAELLGPRLGNDLRRGLVLVATGVGLCAASLIGGGHISPAGLIPGFIGLGYLASHRFAGLRRGGRT